MDRYLSRDIVYKWYVNIKNKVSIYNTILYLVYNDKEVISFYFDYFINISNYEIFYLGIVFIF